MSNNLIPFGKYKGQPIEAIQEDRQYIDWLLAQSWFREKHQDFYTVIINNFQEATETPEHNAMHVKFLDDDYVLDMLGKYKSELNDFFVIERRFESSGWDVVVDLSNYSQEHYRATVDSFYKKEEKPVNASGYSFDEDQFLIFEKSVRNLRFYIEIKPTVSDDFPSVLRQIKNGKIDRHLDKGNTKVILLLGEYTGTGATQEQFIAFMKNENITVIFA